MGILLGVNGEPIASEQQEKDELQEAKDLLAHVLKAIGEKTTDLNDTGDLIVNLYSHWINHFQLPVQVEAVAKQLGLTLTEKTQLIYNAKLAQWKIAQSLQGAKPS